jgi:N utilization substance protein B
MDESESQKFFLLPLYKNEDEDREFTRSLFRLTVLHNAENEKYIAEKTKNWDMDRIAVMDVLLMKMAITEILFFQTVPVKVTLNEYIEISKLYSTPKSSIFINGILDKLVHDFRANEKFQKVGRGLLE